MSDELYEVAFSGKICDGADMGEVKARLGGMFKADESKLAQLFSGKRIVIKRNVDKQTAIKFHTALKRAGAECEVRSISSDGKAATNSTPKPDSPLPAASKAPPAAAPARTATTATTTDPGDAPPPNTDPLGITGNQIEDLAATVAPVGSEMQDEIIQVAAPVIDTSDLDVAPVGADIGSGKKEPDPPPPDTTGISMAEQ